MVWCLAFFFVSTKHNGWVELTGEAVELPEEREGSCDEILAEVGSAALAALLVADDAEGWPSTAGYTDGALSKLDTFTTGGYLAAERKGRDERGQVGTVACASGFIVNMFERSVRLTTPIDADDEHPTGEIILEKERFDDAAGLEDVVRWQGLQTKEVP